MAMELFGTQINPADALVAETALIAVLVVFILKNKDWLLFFYKWKSDKKASIIQAINPNNSVSLYLKNQKGDMLNLTQAAIIPAAKDPFKELLEKKVDISQIFHTDESTGKPWHIFRVDDIKNMNLNQRSLDIIPSKVWNQLILGTATFFYNKGKRDQAKKADDNLIFVIIALVAFTAWNVIQMNDFVQGKLAANIAASTTSSVVEVLKNAGVLKP